MIRHMASSVREAHVVPSAKGWAIAVPGADSISSYHATQHEAVEQAKRLLSGRGGGELVVHGRDGHILESEQVTSSRQSAAAS
jgi:Uncharacterized protein conserved in bacteria (DUF2188)